MRENPLRAADLRIHNQNIILSKIHASRELGISQSELVVATGLKAPTIFRVFASLEEQGLIVPKSQEDDAPDQMQQKKGRKPSLYIVNRHTCYTIGVEFWTAYMSFGIFDFMGNNVFFKKIELKEKTNIEAIVDLIVSEIENSLHLINLGKDKILGIGVAAPGQVDISKKSIVSYPNILGISNFPIVAVLEERLRIPIILQNNCSALAYGEYKYGQFDHDNSLFTFLIRSGVNGSFVNEGRIYANSKGLSIETGHLPISMDGPRCSCGSRGCLQAYIQDLAAYTTENHGLLFEELEESLKTGDNKSRRTIERIALYLSIAMKSISKILGPKSFLFVACTDYIAESIACEVRRLFEEPDIFEGKPQKIFHIGYDPNIAVKGVSDLVIDDFLKS